MTTCDIIQLAVLLAWCACGWTGIILFWNSWGCYSTRNSSRWFVATACVLTIVLGAPLGLIGLIEGLMFTDWSHYRRRR